MFPGSFVHKEHAVLGKAVWRGIIWGLRFRSFLWRRLTNLNPPAFAWQGKCFYLFIIALLINCYNDMRIFWIGNRYSVFSFESVYTIFFVVCQFIIQIVFGGWKKINPKTNIIYSKFIAMSTSFCIYYMKWMKFCKYKKATYEYYLFLTEFHTIKIC